MKCVSQRPAHQAINMRVTDIVEIALIVSFTQTEK